MWDEDPKVHEAHWWTIVWLLKAAVALAAGLSLGFATWEPMLGLLRVLGITAATLLVCWVAPMWLFGKLVSWLAHHRQTGTPGSTQNDASTVPCR
jgi:ABC-type sugar transport system permease subunit